MNFYEMVYIARGELTQQQINNLNEDITSIINADNGKVSKVEHWGIRNFAYKIKKRNKGHYCLLNIEAKASTMNILDQKLKLNESILRTLVIKVEKLDSKPSIIMSKNSYNKREEEVNISSNDEIKNTITE